ncbi:uncharacterized protein LOC120676708 [Panicum virgatum]|uniref:Uncharacterized protein n=1 Tax=Panicum virgatum TaxID=38727 RepID=A0A8T0RM80_PANVG|nr:uncharacterized protein LOC120676708 [Panicum virgatum]KAG2587392.1 hypothetical protein PVAP13_5NG146200 [Panicum virgatum]
MPPSLRPAALLVAAVWLGSAACAADDGDITTLLPPGTASPFPFCPVRPAGASTGPFPWMTPPPPSAAMFPQDPGFLPSVARPVGSSAVAWLPLLAAVSAFLVFLR